MDRGAWWTTVHEVTKSQTQANNLHTQQGLMWAGRKNLFLLPMQFQESPLGGARWPMFVYFQLEKLPGTFFFFFLLYLQGYQGVLSSLLFISIFNQGLIHKKVLNGKSENLERVVN